VLTGVTGNLRDFVCHPAGAEPTRWQAATTTPVGVDMFDRKLRVADVDSC
jgi:hypothetical protein